jgi:hypothetical protein
MTFTTYTDHFVPDSEAVDAAYYNADDQTLAVVLDGGSTYLYENFPPHVWQNFRSASSKGRFYALTVKSGYGPGEYLGYNADDDFEQDDSPVVSANDLRVKQGLTITPGLVDKRYPLYSVPAPAEVAPETFRHEVKFVVEGGNKVSSYNVDAVSVDGAVEALSEATLALGLNVDVKEVTVYFE